MKTIIIILTILFHEALVSYAQARFSRTPVLLAPITTSSTSLIIPFVNTYPPSIFRQDTTYYLDVIFWEIALDSAFTQRVAWALTGASPLGDIPDCGKVKLDTAAVLLEGVRTGSQHFFRMQVLNINLLGINPQDSVMRLERFSPFTRPILIQTPLQSKPTAPRLLLSTNIANDRLTLNWLPAQGLPTLYEMQISRDSTFQTGTLTRTSVTTSITFNGLSSNTRYYYRIRASNLQGISSFSSVASQTTKDKFYPFLINRLHDFDRVSFLEYQGDMNQAIYYTYTQRPKISVSAADSLAQFLLKQNFAVDSIWFQESVPEAVVGGESRFVARASKIDERFTNLGFVLFRRQHNFGASNCNDIKGYLYHSLVPVSVRESHQGQMGNGEVEIFPNPTHDNISLLLNLTSASEVQYEIWNVLGHSVHSSSKQFLAQGAGTIPIATDALPNGVYMVRVALRSAFAAPVYLYRQFTVVH